MQQQWIDANSPTGCRHGSIGLSPGLKYMSLACFLPRLRRGRPRPGPSGVPKKERQKPLLFCIWAHILIESPTRGFAFQQRYDNIPNHRKLAVPGYRLQGGSIYVRASHSLLQLCLLFLHQTLPIGIPTYPYGALPL